MSIERPAKATRTAHTVTILARLLHVGKRPRRAFLGKIARLQEDNHLANWHIFSIADGSDFQSLHVEITASQHIVFDLKWEDRPAAIEDICLIAPAMIRLSTQLKGQSLEDIGAVTRFLDRYKGRVPDSLRITLIHQAWGTP